VCGAVAVTLVVILGATVLRSPAASASAPAGFGEGSGFCSSAVPGGYDLGASFDDVFACGPANNSGTGYYVPASGTYKGFFEDAPWTYQCTELADRFLFDIWGKGPIYGGSLDGKDFASTVHADYPSVPLVTNGTAGQPYVAGDIVSFTGNSKEPDGHVAVVTASTENSSGDGTVTIMEENAASSGQENLTVSSWTLQAAAGSWVTPYEFDALAQPDTEPPTTPGALQAFGYSHQVDLFWTASTDDVGVAGYEVLQGNRVVGDTTATYFADSSVSKGQTYIYEVIAFDAAGNDSVAATIQIRIQYDASNRAWVSTAAGPAECGRAGGSSDWFLVCTVDSSTGWHMFYGPGHDDLGYPLDSAWVQNGNGTVSYCALTGEEPSSKTLHCTQFNGAKFYNASSSQATDWGYADVPSAP